MPSLHPGYAYDVFISYRHNDNLDGWVTEFVQNLEKELRATIKEPITIYFDQNPHDGLLESHHVDKSLEGKLKCLLFIPILSQTYCDPKSFAWQHEFCAFNRAAQADTLGRDIRLRNGNVASRILPVRIHDLDAQDQAMVEQETGSALRAIDFIYKEPGVNRPLKSGDSRDLNQNKTDYRNQVNKVANAVKELLLALEASPPRSPENNVLRSPVSTAHSSKRWIGIFLAASVLLAAGWWLSRDRLSPGTTQKVRLAVIPFQNMESLGGENPYGVGMATEVRTLLTTTKNFEFISSIQATLSYATSPKTPDQIGRELGVDYVLTGLYQIAGDQIKIQVELFDTKTTDAVWAISVESMLNDILRVQAEVARGILSKFSFQQSVIRASQSINPQAITYAAKGHELFNRSNYEGALSQFSKAINLDSTYTFAWLHFLESVGFLWRHTGIETYKNQFIQGRSYLRKRFSDKNLIKKADGIYYYLIERDLHTAKLAFEEVIQADPGDLDATFYLAVMNKRLNNFQAAVSLAESCIAQEPLNRRYWQELWHSLFHSGNLEDALRVRLRIRELGFLGSVVLFEEAILSNQVDQLSTLRPDRLFPFYRAVQVRQWNNVVEIGKQLTHNPATARIYIYALQEVGKNFAAEAKALLSNVDTTQSGYNYKLDEYFALVGQVDLAKKQISFSPEDGSDRFTRLLDLADVATIHALSGQYGDATKAIDTINSEYPEFGGFQIFQHPIFDRAKRQSPEFLNALSRVKYPPKATMKYPYLLE